MYVSHNNRKQFVYALLIQMLGVGVLSSVVNLQANESRKFRIIRMNIITHYSLTKMHLSLASLDQHRIDESRRPRSRWPQQEGSRARQTFLAGFRLNSGQTKHLKRFRVKIKTTHAPPSPIHSFHTSINNTN